MDFKKIEKLEELLSEHIDKDSTIIETKISNLTAPGDNYGSQIYKVDLKLKKHDGSVNDLNIVAKQIPESQFFQNMFNVQVTFNSETAFYTSIVPTLQNFQKKNGLEVFDAFPKFYGARNNLNGINNIVDKDALIVLENLKVKGYKNIDRTIGFDMETSKLILKSLAELHAVALALKLNEPGTFEKQIKAHCACFVQNANLDDDKDMLKIVDLLEELRTPESIIEKFKNAMTYAKTPPKTPREPFATLIHTDYWVNNIMVASEEGITKDIKIVDFQIYDYNSPAIDLIFFLFTSVQTPILKRNLDDLIKYYHQIFTAILSDFNCDTAPFTYDALLKEIKECLKVELVNCMFMLVFIIRGPKEGQEINTNGIPNLSVTHLTAEDKDRLTWLLDEFEKRGWI